MFIVQEVDMNFCPHRESVGKRYQSWCRDRVTRHDLGRSGNKHNYLTHIGKICGIYLHFLLLPLRIYTLKLFSSPHLLFFHLNIPCCRDFYARALLPVVIFSWYPAPVTNRSKLFSLPSHSAPRAVTTAKILTQLTSLWITGGVAWRQVTTGTWQREVLILPTAYRAEKMMSFMEEENGATTESKTILL